MNVFYHRSDCEGTHHASKFVPAIMTNKRGTYIGMMCEECGVSNRESGYYDTEEEAWSDWKLMDQGLPITNPREPETDDERIMRRLKAAGLDPQPDAQNEDIGKPAKVTITPDGSVDIDLEDPLGAKLHLRLSISAWGLIGFTSTGFGSVITDEGFLVILPESDHMAESQQGMAEELEELNRSLEEVSQATPTIDA